MNLLQFKHIAVFIILPFSIFGQIEICDNGIDDDGDTFIDLNDEDCICDLVEPISLIPNPSFEDMDCCPSERSQMDCASNWIQASEPTTDYIHTCDWLGWDQFPPPFPFPDGEGIMGFRDGRVRNGVLESNWKEYAGACLTSPLLKDSVYKFIFDVGFVTPSKSPPIDITFFGTSDCVNLPFGVNNEELGCPTNGPGWEKLGQVSVSGGNGNTWVNSSLTIIPTEDIHAVAVGPDCPAVFSDESIYYFFDNLVLADIASFQLEIKEIDHPCSSEYRMSVPEVGTFVYQWYLDGIALIGEDKHELSQNYGEGFYQVRIIDGSSCRVSANFEYRIPEFAEQFTIQICEGESYEFGELTLEEPGTYLDTFSNDDNCDVITTLNLEVIGHAFDTKRVVLLTGDSYSIDGLSFSEEGSYPLILESSLGCDSLVQLELSFFDVYIPNVFSTQLAPPDNSFRPFFNEEYVSDMRLEIYDRWGNNIFIGDEWNAKDYQSGVYVYKITIIPNMGNAQTFRGVITLLD